MSDKIDASTCFSSELDINFPKYISRQIANLFPDSLDEEYVKRILGEYIEIALGRTIICINSVIPWKKSGGFNYLNSCHYPILLYYLSNTIWKRTGDDAIPLRLFLLSKAINGIDLFYAVDLPAHFMLGHGLGIIFANSVEYGDYSLFSQGCTIGRTGEKRPSFERGVIMFANSMVIGNCLVRENTVIAPGVVLVDQETPGNCYVFQGSDGRPFFKKMDKYYAKHFFSMPD